MATFLYFLYAIVNLELLMLGINLYRDDHECSMVLVIIVLLGMIYDNAVICLGKWIGERPLLKFLNYLRFLLHSLLVPLLLVTAVQIAEKAGVTWASSQTMLSQSWAVSTIMISWGLYNVFRQEELVPIKMANTLRYKPRKAHFPFATIFAALLVGLSGVFIWSTAHCPWMFAGTIVMLLGNALPKNDFGTLLASGTDSVFIIVDDRKTSLEQGIIFLILIGMLILPTVYILSTWLDFANYSLPLWITRLGIVALTFSLWLFWRSHTDLGYNWSPRLQIRENHTLTTKGVYRNIRHPMYTAFILWSLAQVVLLPNWIVGPAGFISWSIAYITRIDQEEKMLIDQFGTQYKAYMQRTKRLIPYLL